MRSAITFSFDFTWTPPGEEEVQELEVDVSFSTYYPASWNKHHPAEGGELEELTVRHNGVELTDLPGNLTKALEEHAYDEYDRAYT
jgi:hypothetical protein